MTDISQAKLKEIIVILTQLMKSDFPTVRSAVAINLKVPVASPKFLLREIPSLQNDGFEILKILAKDPLDSVRIGTVETLMFCVYDNKVHLW
jgi:hypothetical protein